MARYIDKNEVENILRKLWKEDDGHNPEHRICYNKALQEVQCELDTLEVKKEILDKKSKTDLMRKCVHKAYERGYDMGVVQTTNKIKHDTKEVDLEKEYEEFVVDDPIFGNFITNDTMGMELAKHFFELGLKVQKGA